MMLYDGWSVKRRNKTGEGNIRNDIVIAFMTSERLEDACIKPEQRLKHTFEFIRVSCLYDNSVDWL